MCPASRTLRVIYRSFVDHTSQATPDSSLFLNIAPSFKVPEAHLYRPFVDHTSQTTPDSSLFLNIVSSFKLVEAHLYGPFVDHTSQATPDSSLFLNIVSSFKLVEAHLYRPFVDHTSQATPDSPLFLNIVSSFKLVDIHLTFTYTVAMNLTERQREVLGFIKGFVRERGSAPSYEEIRAHFGFRSLNSVFKHLKQLEIRGHLDSPWGNRKRVLSIREPSRMNSVTLPLLGIVAAGSPIDAPEIPEEVEVPENLLGRGECFALRVRGDSMIDDGIHDRDVVLVRRQDTADNGQTVIALVDGEATIKRFYKEGNRVELRPANPAMKPIVLKRNQDLKIRGIVVGLLRKY